MVCTDPPAHATPTPEGVAKVELDTDGTKLSATVFPLCVALFAAGSDAVTATARRPFPVPAAVTAAHVAMPAPVSYEVGVIAVSPPLPVIEERLALIFAVVIADW